MNASEALMLKGIAAVCPDCGDERILLKVAGDEFCCMACDAAILCFDAMRGNTDEVPVAG